MNLLLLLYFSWLNLLFFIKIKFSFINKSKPANEQSSTQRFQSVLSQANKDLK